MGAGADLRHRQPPLPRVLAYHLHLEHRAEGPRPTARGEDGKPHNRDVRLDRAGGRRLPRDLRQGRALNDMRDEFMITRQGKQYVLFAGLLDEAHNRGLRGIDTELVQVPTPENGNVAVVKATVEMEASEGNRTFSGIGDASPENVGRNIVPHIIRMAETRAKARALRDAVNVGATALEELSDGDDAPPANYPPPRGLQNTQGRPRAGERDASRDASAGSSTPDNGRANAEAVEGTSQRANRRGKGGSSRDKARKSQIDLLRTLAEELRGENGVARLESRIGKPLGELSRAEADEWIDRLTPAEGRD